ncbi:MAG: hypothetical protein IPM34_00630 [Saprospiraceae bacterium]|nr:hypothetical protein [Saprospiraceae bacterium]
MRILVVFYYFLVVISVKSQSYDHQWLVLDSMAKTGYNLNTKSNVYSQQLSTFCNNDIFGIDSVDYPIQLVNSFVPRNDFFVIYEDGTFYNTRNINKGSVWPDASSNERMYKIKSAKNIKYLYLTNIYEEDDPPESIRINSPSGGRLLEFETTQSNTMQLNHDFVSGKDVVLIIPAAATQSCGNGYFNITYDPVVFTDSKVFNNFSSASFQPLPGASFLQGSISNIPISSSNHFINLRIKEDLPTNYLGSKSEIQLVCNNGSTVQAISDTIRAGHDPNLIKLMCIYHHKAVHKRRDRYIGVYRAQFQNSGNSVVDSVKVTLKMPNNINANSVDVFAYRFGARRGYRPQADTFVVRRRQGQTIEFLFKRGFLIPHDSLSENFNLYAKGGIDFRVELKGNPESNAVRLIPLDGHVTFDSKKQTFDKMLDLNIPVEKINKRNKRKINTMCACAPSWYKGDDCQRRVKVKQKEKSK